MLLHLIGQTRVENINSDRHIWLVEWIRIDIFREKYLYPAKRVIHADVVRIRGYYDFHPFVEL